CPESRIVRREGAQGNHEILAVLERASFSPRPAGRMAAWIPHTMQVPCANGRQHGTGHTAPPDYLNHPPHPQRGRECGEPVTGSRVTRGYHRKSGTDHHRVAVPYAAEWSMKA